MTQNIYDDPTFFDGYSKLQRSIDGLDGAPEWPTLRSLLPELRDARVVDLGCGYGWFCRYAASRHAASVLGVDVSEKMLARAASLTSEARITYARGDLEALELPANAFDLVFSSLAFHYVERFPALLGTIHDALTASGQLLFSVEHPIFTAPREQGFTQIGEGPKRWPVDSYQKEGARVTNWLADGVIKQHRTMATLVNALVDQGFALRRLIEWSPTQAQVDAAPSLADEWERPTFLIVAASKPAR